MSNPQPRTVTVLGEHGLHLVPCSLIARIANTFPCHIEISRGQRIANAKNIFDLMSLGAGPGTVLTLQAIGDNSSDALNALEQLFQAGLEPHSRAEATQ